ncbi:putative chromosome segregation ATPase [Bodo saltans virus]|uniref:Chromosome segregation ATPase n=1 Tax=Bodo saltans virus TaxID=2024608 RepID=A0A2H4UW06_9VIRU|nr:putative chromosome segregation ATPase [Bodo saltans virus]ATZ81111.1 putative chromosome segregation ATPase [Bodo saltans virus]
MTDNSVMNNAQQWVCETINKMTHYEHNIINLHHEKDALQQYNNLLSQEKDTLQHENNTLKCTNNLLQQKNDTLQHEKNLLQHEKEILVQENNVLQRKKDALQQEKDTLSHEKNTSLKEKDSFHEAFSVLKNLSCAVLKSEDTLQKEKDSIQQEKKNLQSENDTLLREIEILQKEKDDILKDYEELKESISKPVKKLDDEYIILLPDKTNNTNEFIAEINSLKNKIEECQKEKDILFEQIRAANAKLNSHHSNNLELMIAEIERLLQIIHSASTVSKTQFAKIISDSSIQQTPRFLTTPRTQNLFTSRSQQMFTETQPSNHLLICEIDRFVQIIESAFIVTQSQIQKIINDTHPIQHPIQHSSQHFTQNVQYNGQYNVPLLNLSQVASAPPQQLY